MSNFLYEYYISVLISKTSNEPYIILRIDTVIPPPLVNTVQVR